MRTAQRMGSVAAMARFAPPPPFDGALDAVLAYIDGNIAPPVDSWHPQHRGTIDICIRADGSWWHEGGEIKRPAMTRLFSRILRREADGSHVLVTPAELLRIEVEDAAFTAVEMRAELWDGEQLLLFRLSNGENILADADHPIYWRGGDAGARPYIRVRGDAARPLEARLTRSCYYALAERADDAGVVWSAGQQFSLLGTAK